MLNDIFPAMYILVYTIVYTLQFTRFILLLCYSLAYSIRVLSATYIISLIIEYIRRTCISWMNETGIIILIKTTFEYVKFLSINYPYIVRR